MRLRHLLLLGALAACNSTSTAGEPDAATPDAAFVGETLHDQPLVVGGETRYFYLHVPPSATAHAPLLVDFHGTGFTDIRPEEEWGLDEMVAASDALGFIVARPRSHSFDYHGTTLYQWEAQPGDLQKNFAFAQELVTHLSGRYSIDPARVYASGFSNGTNMSLQTLKIPSTPFHGFGIVGGGIYFPFQVTSWPDPAPRIYATSGYHDVNYQYQRQMDGWLAANHYPMASLWVRETKAMHELRGWQFREMFEWLDTGTKTPEGSLAAGWQNESFPSQSSLLTLARNGTEWIATGADGSLWARATSGTWTQTLTSATGFPVLTGVCMSGSNGYATGEASNFVTTNGGASWHSTAAVPPFGSASGSSQLFTVECGPGAHVVGGGPGLSAVSTDGGATWASASMLAMGGYENVVHAVRHGSSGAWVSAGLVYAGRSTDGVAFTPSDVGDAYLYDVAEAGPGHWFAVGIDGVMLRSDDDARTWQPVLTGITDALYAVRFASPLVGMAVGLHGTALVTTDGGAVWQPRPAGIDRMLGDIAWIDASHALVIGERGTVLTFQP